MMDECLLKVEHLSTRFQTKHGVLPAVNDVNFSVRKGEILGIVGESGCGKSVMSMSILKIIEKYGGMLSQESTVTLDGKQLTRMSEQQLCALRGSEMSMIFQDPMTSLNPVFTIRYQMVETIRRHLGLNRKEAHALAVEWLEKVGLPDAQKRINEYPHQLSGGMRQRVVIAMALSCNPKLLIADEPTTALDVTIQAQILELLLQLRKQVNAAILLITHDLGVVADLADNIMVMYAGRVIEYGSKRQIFRNPRHPYTQGLLASVPRLDQNTDRLFSIEGNVPNLIRPITGCVFCERCTRRMPVCQQKAPPETVMVDGSRISCWLYQNERKVDGCEE